MATTSSRTSQTNRQENWTYQDYRQLDDGKRYEIINGKLIDMTPSPSIQHNIFSGNLSFAFRSYLKEHAVGRLFEAPVDVKLDNKNVVQPDLVVVLNENRDIIKELAIEGTPDITVEIISPSSIINDRNKKSELYKKFGVKEYSIVDPAYPSVEVYQLKDGQYEVYSFAATTGQVESALLDNLQVNLEDLAA